tara:strand:+ start:1 stop:1017 length:1017 start_codon:yes stop_codon:yes gene_type:complete
MATGENAGTWGTKTNANLDLIEQIVGGFKQVSIAGGAQTTALTVADGALTGTAQARMIEFTGTITGNQIVTIPLDVETFYILKNATTGSFTVEFKYVSGSGSSFTFATTNKGTSIVFATANDGTNPDVIEVQTGGDVVDDTSPQLGGDLDVNGNSIISVSNGNIPLSPNGTGVVQITGNATQSGTLRITEDTDEGSNYIDIKVPALASNVTLTLPNNDGNADEFLKTDGSGNLSFAAVSGGTSWQAVKTSGFTAVAGEGYFINTTSGAITMTLPASPTIGDEVSFIDYAGTFDTNNLTIGRNSENIQGSAADLTVSVERAANTLVYTDGTQGWLLKAK